jgi:hypothetical protein
MRSDSQAANRARASCRDTVGGVSAVVRVSLAPSRAATPDAPAGETTDENAHAATHQNERPSEPRGIAA